MSEQADENIEIGYVELAVRLPGRTERKVLGHKILTDGRPILSGADAADALLSSFLAAMDAAYEQAQQTLRLYGAEGLIAALKGEADAG